MHSLTLLDIRPTAPEIMLHLPEIAAMLLPAFAQAPAPLETGIGLAPCALTPAGRSTEEYLSSSSICTQCSKQGRER